MSDYHGWICAHCGILDGKHEKGCMRYVEPPPEPPRCYDCGCALHAGVCECGCPPEAGQ
jgi:hypothetical protein